MEGGLEMGLRAEPVRSSRRKREIKEIYQFSFAREDRMPFWMMLLMSYLWHTEFLAFYDGDTLCGILYMASLGKLTFIMFFAVEEGLRSKGHGGQILAQAQARHAENKLIVSIEPCLDGAEDLAVRTRRRQFYLRNGFAPSDHFMRMGGKDQEVLIKNGTFDRREFKRFFLLYSNCTVIPKIWRVT